MKRLALALAVSLSGGAWGDDVPRAVGLSRALALTTDGERLVLDGGVWLRDDVAIAAASELVRLRAENGELRTTATPTAPTLLWAVGVSLVIGLAGGLALGLTLSSR